MSDLKVTLVQTELEWEAIEANLNRFTEKLDQIESADVIVLPEMFTTGFSMKPQPIAEDFEHSKAVEWIKEQALIRNTAITGSIAIKDGSKYVNRMLFALPDGELFTYDKRHLFTMAGEHNEYSRGEKQVIVEYRGWRIALFVCYDLRFPVWSRNTSEYDLAVYVANWPAAREYPWSTLLKARAIENQCYVVGVNRIGEDGNGIDYSGASAAIDPKGQEIVNLKADDTLYTADLSKSELLDFRNKFPVLNDADRFTLDQ